MTDTITTENEQSTSQHPAPGTIEHIDPHTLIVDANVRDQADLNAPFVASVKEHGVLTPIVVVRDSDGQLWVRSGQRRTLAAREAALPTVPVYVRAATAGTDEKAQLVERVCEQIVENDQRTRLTDVQRPRGIQQISMLGSRSPGLPRVCRRPRTASRQPRLRRTAMRRCRGLPRGS